MTSIVLRAAVFAAALQQFLFPIFVNPFRDGQDAVRAGEPSQIEPAGYAFAIWGPIYLLALIYAAYQLTKRGRRDAVTAHIAPFAIPLYLGSTVWLMAASEWIPLWLTMPILAIMAVCATASLVIASRAGADRTRSLLVVVPFGLYAGWTVCATFVNIAEVAPQFGFDRLGLTIPAWGIASIAAATALAGAIVWLSRGALMFSATVLWALTGIIIASLQRDSDQTIVIAAGAAAVTVIVLTIATKFAARTGARATN